MEEDGLMVNMTTVMDSAHQIAKILMNLGLSETAPQLLDTTK
jgi:hypothetical protein